GGGKTTLPAAPSILSATGMSSSQISLHWQDNSSNETGFKVQRASGSSGPWSLVATLGAGATTWSDTGISPSTTCFYEVCAYNSKGNSSMAGPVSATTLAASCTYSISPGSA